MCVRDLLVFLHKRSAERNVIFPNIGDRALTNTRHPPSSPAAWTRRRATIARRQAEQPINLCPHLALRRQLGAIAASRAVHHQIYTTAPAWRARFTRVARRGAHYAVMRPWARFLTAAHTLAPHARERRAAPVALSSRPIGSPVGANTAATRHTDARRKGRHHVGPKVGACNRHRGGVRGLGVEQVFTYSCGAPTRIRIPYSACSNPVYDIDTYIFKNAVFTK